MIRALILALIILTSLAGAQEPVGAPLPQAVTVLERVIPRACITSVQLKDPAQCHVKAIDLTPTTECRGPIGEKLVCSGFTVQLEGPGCSYVITRHVDCENVHVKKVEPK